MGLLAFLAFLTAGSIIILAGFAGEYISIVALYRRSATGSEGRVVLISLTGLLFAVLAPPAFKFWVMALRITILPSDDKKESPQPRKPTPPAEVNRGGGRVRPGASHRGLKRARPSG